jgi:hypothetical protein
MQPGRAVDLIELGRSALADVEADVIRRLEDAPPGVPVSHGELQAFGQVSGRLDEALGILAVTLGRLDTVAELLRDLEGPDEAPLDPEADARRATAGRFRREGEYWSVALDGEPVRIRDSKGMRHLAELIARPGREVHVLELVAAVEGVDTDRHGGDPALRLVADPGDEILDDRAIAAFRRRGREIASELAEAESWHDAERAARLRAEEQALMAELAEAAGLGDRRRRSPSDGERARVNVSRAIRSAIERIAACDAELGRHLSTTVRTGRYCAYLPDGRTLVP